MVSTERKRLKAMEKEVPWSIVSKIIMVTKVISIILSIPKVLYNLQSLG